jgi:hypothetical protein
MVFDQNEPVANIIYLILANKIFKMKAIFYLLQVIAVSSIYGQSLPQKTASPLNVKQIHSGHSLTDPLFANWPGQYVNLIGSINNLPPWQLFDAIVGKSTIPGSSMRARWQSPPGYGSPDARHQINNWDLLVITERVPLLYSGGNNQQWYISALDSQRVDLSRFVNNAWTNGRNGQGAPTLLWTTWTNIDNSNGPWRQMLDVLGTEWETMQDFANTNRPSGAPPVYIIPGHKMMARLYDDIQIGGIVPGITNINQFFSDNIHPNALGAYAVSLIHYACIFNTNPTGLTNQLTSPPTTPPAVSPALATYLQGMIWSVVTQYSRTGVRSPLLSADASGFEAFEFGNKSKLVFSISNMEDLDRVMIEHSIDGEAFDAIKSYSTKAMTSKKLQFVHELPVMGNNYYRLKYINMDGATKYSRVASVYIKHEATVIYPNPSSNKIYVKSHLISAPNLVLKDMNGRVVATTKGGFELDVADVPEGVYWLLVQTNGDQAVHKVMVNRK